MRATSSAGNVSKNSARSSVEAPLVLDSTERDVLEAALDAYPGRAILNSFNLESGREKADFVLGLARKHGAFVVAMTIDEEGMAHTADRKVEIARRIHALTCEEHGLPLHRYTLDGVAAAHSAVESGVTGKVLIDVLA